MGSYFASGIKRRGSPAYCKKNKLMDVVPTRDVLPVNLNAYATWIGYDSEGPFNLVETIGLRLDAGGAQYASSSSNSGRGLRLILTATIIRHVWNIELQLLRDGLLQDQRFFPDVRTDFRKPFGTPIVRRGLRGAPGYTELQALG